MSLILGAMFALTPVQQQTAPPDLAPGMRKASPADVAAFNREGFQQKDRDRSGFLDPREASAMEPRDRHRDSQLGPAPAAGAADPVAERKWMMKLDNDRDGKVSEAEYQVYMAPWIMLSGVPIGWNPKG